MRTKKGIVVSDKMDKTIVVEVVSSRAHPIYKKRFKITSRFKAHDENNTYKTGDEVTIQETKPLSKTKRWTVETTNK